MVGATVNGRPEMEDLSWAARYFNKKSQPGNTQIGVNYCSHNRLMLVRIPAWIYTVCGCRRHLSSNSSNCVQACTTPMHEPHITTHAFTAYAQVNSHVFPSPRTIVIWTKRCPMTLSEQQEWACKVFVFNACFDYRHTLKMLNLVCQF